MKSLSIKERLLGVYGHEGSAVISPCGKYRYSLDREWGIGGSGKCVWVMLNPSTADAQTDDPTVRKCIKFSRKWGFASLRIVNLFAFRATSPADMKTARHAGWQENSEHIHQALRVAKRIVVAWGNHGHFLDAGQDFLRTNLDETFYCLDVNKSGHPKHPLYVPDSSGLQMIDRIEAVK